MQTFWQDVRYGARWLKAKPGFAAIAIITLALGIGANTAIFSVINAVLLRPLPYPNPAQLIIMRSNDSALNIADIKQRMSVYEDLGGITPQPLDYTGGGEPMQIQAGMVTGGYFNTLGVAPILGRSITYEDDHEGGERVIVLSYGLWQRQFGGSNQVLEQSLVLSGNSYRIIGVMPADFRSPREALDAWAPVWVVSPLAANFRGVHFMRVYCRLREGASLAQARGEMTGVDEYISQTYPASDRTRGTFLMPLQERIVGNVREALWILFGAVGLVLLIACANFANLLLARTAQRQQEIVIRTALGASRARVIRQLLTESALIACLGGLAGTLLAWVGLKALVSLKPANLPRLESIQIDERVFLFTLAVSLVTGLVFGLLPAWTASRLNVNEGLKDGGRTSTAGGARGRLRSLLVVSELALALVLLVGAGLLIRSLMFLQTVDPGFDKDNLLTMRIELPEARYREIPRQIQYRNAVLEAVNSLPGLQAGMISELPMAENRVNHNFIIEGRTPLAPGEEPDIETRSVSHQYFDTMRMRLLQGRAFTSQDVANSLFVCVINESAVRTFFENESPLGQRLVWASGPRTQWMTIVGVVGDVKQFGLEQEELPAVYTLYEQQDQPWKRWMVLVARGQSETTAMTAAIKEKIWSADRQIPIAEIRSMTDVMAQSLAAQRFNLLLLGVFAGVALLLAAVGIYGVISYSASQRTHEIGIRLALGASTGDVLRLVLKQGLWLAFWGVTLGLTAALALTRVMGNLLFGVGVKDPLTFGLLALLLAGVAVLACYLPARRAARTDPIVALRYE